MKSFIPLVYLCAFFLAGCQVIDGNEGGGTRLRSIIMIDPDGSRQYESFRYDKEGRLVEVEEGNGTIHKVQYVDDKVIQVATYSTIYSAIDSKPIFLDSVFYRDDAQINKILYYDRNGSESLKLSSIQKFNYNNLGLLESTEDQLTVDNENRRIRKYYWNEGVIERAEYYSNNELYYESFYTYDEQVNYRKHDPRYLGSPISQLDHNITVASAKDYYGNLDLICWPCESRYGYNAQGLPVEVVTNWGMTMRLQYD